MGGDLGPRSTLPAAVNFAAQHPHVQLILFGLADTFSDFSPLSNPSLPNISLVNVSQVVEMDESPIAALRSKRDSSMWRAVEIVAKGEADACVSAGNTGALMAMGKIQLKTWPGIDRPAICRSVPTKDKPAFLLDLGANVECSSEQFLQFALMGSALMDGALVTEAKSSAKVALLNMGSEAMKGPEVVRAAAELLDSNEHINYVGFVEGGDIFEGVADVIVCDGFTGNVALKASEGVASLLASELRSSLYSSLWGRFVGWLARPILRQWQHKFDPATYNGASLLGLQGTVIKSHGGADSRGFEVALGVALDQAERQVPQQIERCLAQTI